MGSKIRAMRERHHMTQDELAKRLGVTVQAVQSWEWRRRNPRLHRIRRMAKIFDCSLEALL